jgi:hypothetical protein
VASFDGKSSFGLKSLRSVLWQRAFTVSRKLLHCLVVSISSNQKERP